MPVVADEESVEATATSLTKRTRAARGGGSANQALFANFITLEERKVSTKGNITRYQVCLCLYCKKHFDAAVKKATHPPPMSPRKIARTKRDCTNHLKHCVHYINESKRARRQYEQFAAAPPPPEIVTITETPANRFLTTTSSSLSATGATSLGPNTLETYFTQAIMSGAEVNTMEQKLIELIVDMALPFNLPERPSFRRFVESIRVNASTKLPGRTKTKVNLLANRAISAVSSMEEMISLAFKKGHRAGLAIDGWSNVNKMHIEGVILTAGVASFPLDAPEADFEHHGIAVARGWETFLCTAYPKYTFCYHVSDDAGQCARGRRILALRHPYMLLMRCWAHQVNLMVKALLGLSDFKEVCKLAIASAKAIKASSAKWLPRLRTVADRIYGKSPSKNVMTVGETRWNSTQGCFATLLRIRHACQVFSIEHEASTDKFPTGCLAWRDTSFWVKLEDAELLIRPFCNASFLMQRNCNTMAHVVLILLHLVQHIQEYCGDTAESRLLVCDIEKRWAREENSLFFLAFALHPSFRETAVDIVSASQRKHGNWESDRNPLSVARLTHAALFYYEMKELQSSDGTAEELNRSRERLRRHIKKWLTGTSNLAGMATYQGENEENVVEWWEENAVEFPEIANLAKFLLDCPIQSASCERLFKDFDRFHTKVRNKLHASTTLKSTQILHDIRRKYPEENKPGSGTFTRNRMVNPEEYDRKNMEDSDTPATDDDEEASGVPPIDPDEDKLDDQELCRIPGESEMDFWVRCLVAVNGGDDLSEEDTEDEEEEGDVREWVEDEDEDPCEKRVVSLLALPNVNVPTYPQENAHYFATRKYVRKDKFTVSSMIFKDLVVSWGSVYK